MPFALPDRRAVVSASIAALLAAVAVVGLAAASSDRADAVPAEGPFSIGNRVWIDNGSDGAGGFNAAQRNNGLQDSSEVGVNGVRVELYEDENTNGVVDPGEFVRYDLTAPGDPGAGRPGSNLNGYYLFDSLEAGTYIVVIPSSEFGTGDALAGHHSSTFNGTEALGASGAVGSPATDLDDNGIEPASRRPGADGVRSGAIVLDPGALADPGTEPTGETDLSLQPDPGQPLSDVGYNGADGTGPTGWDGSGSIGRDNDLTDETSNVAVDFGFIPPMSIGNRIWLDDSGDPAQWGPGGSRNNGLFDATDDSNLVTPGVQPAGVANVDVQLYYDGNGDSNYGPGDTLVDATSTSSTGYFLFDGLGPGNYFVHVPSTEFGGGQPLNGLVSSFDAVAQVNPTNGTDTNDNGIDNAAPATNGISSRQVQLVYLGESTTESDPGIAGVAADSDSDLTIDFSFTRPPMSLGNQVWLDDHPTTQALRGNGLKDAGEPAIAGVEVALYRDLNANGIVDAGEDTGLRDTTDANGFYLFANIPAGNYIVAVTAANFTAGGPLENLISSRSTVPNPIAADNQTDNNDNGIDTPVVGVGIISSRINLAASAEATNEPASATNDPADGVGGRGGYGIPNNSSDLSVDFGFHAPMSLGNRVWLDDTGSAPAWQFARDNGVLESADDLDNPNIAGVQGQGVAGVTLRLYRDLDTDAVIDGGEDSGRTTTSNASGYYLFDGLTRGNYIVAVEASNFTAGGRLDGFWSSFSATPPTDNAADNTDDGVGTVPDPTFGVASPSIQLSYTTATTGSEPTAEADPTPQTQANRGLNGELDSFSNLTVDFGFSRPAMSIGNRVWLDDHPTAAALRGNGLLDSGESAVAGVQLALYSDLNTNGAVDAGEDTGHRETTDSSGFYLFSNLPAGTYIVAVTEASFDPGGPVAGLISSPAPVPADNQTDDDDNGIDTAVAGIGIISNRIQLGVGAEPLAENVSGGALDGPNGRGTNGELDANSDLTVDFGFARPSVSVGDFVWVDTDGDGVQTAGEPGIAGVPLAIRDASGDPVVDVRGSTVGITTTDATGAYRFTDLPPLAADGYTVTVDVSSAALAGYWPTVTGAGTPATDSSPGTATSSTLPANGNSDTTLDFGFVPTVAVGNYVWLDDDRDGIQDGTEAGIAGVSVTLLTAAGLPASQINGTAVAAQVTDASGHYVFSGLRAGQYTLAFGSVAGHFPTITGAGTAATDSDPSTTSGTTATFTIAPTATGDTRAVTAEDAAGDALFINPTLDAGYVERSVDLSIAKAFGAANTSSRVANWTLAVASVGTDDSVDPLVVTDQLSPLLTFVSGGGDGFACLASGQTVTCIRTGPLAVGDTATISLETSYSSASASIPNTAMVDGGASDVETANDSSTASAPASALAAPVVTPPTTTPAPARPRVIAPALGPVPALAEPVAATPTPSASPTTEPSDTPEPSTTPEPSGESEADGADLTWLMWTVIAALLIAAAILTVVLVVRGRRGF